MRFVYQRPYKSLTAAPTGQDLPSFTLITGENGAGKSHFLEAIQNQAILLEAWDPRRTPQLMNAAVLQQTDHLLSAGEPRSTKVERLRTHATAVLADYRGDPNAAQFLRDRLVNDGLLTRESVDRAESVAGKPISEWGEPDFGRYTPREIGHLDLFAVLVADVFQNYSYLSTMNTMREWAATTKGASWSWLCESEFVALYGPPPWELVNRVLADVALSYRYAVPEPALEFAHTAPMLIDQDSGVEISPTDLSSGEKTLLTIALSAYSATSRDAVRHPSLILLDEPDSALHPSMVANLIRLVTRELVDGLNIPVVMTTHSPTTVALAPEESLFVMRRTGEPRLRKASRDESLRSLLVGVPTISVESENRRVVIVEGPNDERIYTLLASSPAGALTSERSLQFMAAGSSELPNGSAAVVDLVTRLRANGNHHVWGLIDRDYNLNEPSEFVKFDAGHHSIENLVLDPLSCVLLLLRDGEERTTIAVGKSYVATAWDDAQRLVDWITELVAQPDSDRTLAPRTYVGGELQVARFWGETRGHDLHKRLLEVFPQLRAHRNRLLDSVVSIVWMEHLWSAPTSARSTLQRIADA